MLVVGIAAVAAFILFFVIPTGGGLEQKLITYEVTRGDLVVSVVEQGTLESSENTEIKCQVRGQSTITKVIESGTFVKKGQELLRLDTLALEEAITERKKFALLTKASAQRLEATVKSAKLAVKEYEEGTYVSELMQLEKDLVVAKSNLKAAENVQRHEEKLAKKNFTNELQVAEMGIVVQQYRQQVAKLQKDIEVLRDFTRLQQLATLKGDLAAAKAEYAAEAERAKADIQRRDQAIAELEHCVVKAPRDGLVIHPSAAQWSGAPDIEEGATVHKTQVMLLMPNLDKMQIKVGIHESMVDRVKKEMPAIVTINERQLQSVVQSVASITRPAGWWTGNVVKYDTIIKLPENEPGLKPGMSAEVQIILAKYENVVTVPVAALLQSPSGDFCWVKEGDQVRRRLLEIGDSNDVFVHVKSGLEEGDEVILNPLDYIDEAEKEALIPQEQEKEIRETEPSSSKPQAAAN